MTEDELGAIEARLQAGETQYADVADLLAEDRRLRGWLEVIADDDYAEDGHFEIDLPATTPNLVDERPPAVADYSGLASTPARHEPTAEESHHAVWEAE